MKEMRTSEKSIVVRGARCAVGGNGYLPLWYFQMTHWFTNNGSGILKSTEEEGMLLIGDTIPDWVKSPAETPDIGERTFKVRGTEPRTCPKCREIPTRALVLDDNYRVGHCSTCGFVWYQLR